MPADRGIQRPRRVLGKGRMEAFSDGVFAIAITLLVLDVAVHPPGTPLEQVLHAWPAYVAYVVSFLTIGAAWLAHTALTDRLAQSDSIFLRLNLLVLLVVAFLPFPTRLVADALRLRSNRQGLLRRAARDMLRELDRVTGPDEPETRLALRDVAAVEAGRED
jgi:uncharacterized membrane protein